MNSITEKTSSELLKELDQLIEKDIQACYKDLEQLKKSTIFGEINPSLDDKSSIVSKTQNSLGSIGEEICEY